MTTIDFRREWVKNKVTKYFGLPNHSFFEYMMANTDELEDNLASYLDDDFFADGGTRKQFFYVFKTKRDKIIEQEVIEEVTVKKVRVAEPPHERKREDVSKKKKKEKGDKGGGKGKKGKKKKPESPPPEPPAEQPADVDPEEEEFQHHELMAYMLHHESEDEEEFEDEEGGDRAYGTTVEQQEDGTVTTITEGGAGVIGNEDSPTDAEVSEIEGSPRDAEEKKKKGKKGKEKKGKKGKKNISEQIDDTAVEEEEEYETVLVKKMIPKYVIDYMLHGGFLTLYEEDDDWRTLKEHQSRFLFMYRKLDEGIPNFDQYETAEKEMPTHLAVGMNTGNLLNLVMFMSNEIYVPILTKGFVEPSLKRERKSLKTTIIGQNGTSRSSDDEFDQEIFRKNSK